MAVSPADARAHCNRSKTLFALNRYDEALVSAERALAIDPAHVESLYTRGMVLGRLHRYDEAIAAFERVLELAPAHPHALAQLATSCLAICAWDKAADVASRLYEAMAAGTAIVAPHTLLQLSASPDVTLAATRRYVEREIPPGPRLDFGASVARSGKIRVAYLSGDFRVHPVAYLTAELFERHDRSRFEIIGVSFGPDDKSELRSRIAKSFDRFHDVRTVGDRDVAALIRRLGVDIAVDLSGHTENARPGILRYRPAPMQVNYLGYRRDHGRGFHRLHHRRQDRAAVRPAAVLCGEDRSPAGLLHGQRPTKRDIAADAVARRGGPAGQAASCSAASTTATRSRPQVFDVWMRLLDAGRRQRAVAVSADSARLRQPAPRGARRAASIRRA